MRRLSFDHGMPRTEWIPIHADTAVLPAKKVNFKRKFPTAYIPKHRIAWRSIFTTHLTKAQKNHFHSQQKICLVKACVFLFCRSNTPLLGPVQPPLRTPYKTSTSWTSQFAKPVRNSFSSILRLPRYRTEQNHQIF